MDRVERFTKLVSRHSKWLIVGILLLTVVMAGGMGQVSQESDLNQFSFGSDAEQAQDYVDANFTAADENTTNVQIIFREDGGDVLTKESLVREIELQQELLEDEEIRSTLADQSFRGLSNVVAQTAIAQQRNQTVGPGGVDATLEEQRQALASMNEEEIDAMLAGLLGENGGQSAAFAFVPRDFEAGSTSADARAMFVTQRTTADTGPEGQTPENITDSQLRMDEIVDDRYGDNAFTFGSGIVNDEINRSMSDSMAIVLPLALLFVVLVLTIAYRDLLDILLGVSGIFLVLIWTFGFMGWTGITFNQIMIAVPVLLVGLSIDYAIHVFMRHREQRNDPDEAGPDTATDTRGAMEVVLMGLGAALLWVTITAMIGFLSNLVSPLPPIQDFGLASAFGIASTLLIYGTFVPALKVEIDEFLEGRGWDRRKQAFGTGGGRFSEVLAGGKTLARRTPWAVVAFALLLTVGGVYGATQVDTSFQQEDFLADDPPGWMDSLPEPFAPGEYQIKQQLDFVDERFSRDQQTEILIRGDVTDPATLERMAAVQEDAAQRDSLVTLPNGRAAVESPLTGMQALADANEQFNASFTAADTDGDGVPERNLRQLYDAYYAAAPGEAAGTLQLTEDGEYAAARMTFTVSGEETTSTTASDTRDLADTFEGSPATATATGQIVVFDVIEQELFSTVIQTLIVTFIAVFAFLMLAYRFVHGSALLGAVTLLPILLTVTWILGSMYLLGVPFNVITGTITSLTIGLGVAYNIHISERYQLEIDRGQDAWTAMHRAVTGTGGALLGSAGTTIGGFGVLAFAILPALQQFGIITGLTIAYAFLGSVFVLPSFLVLWTRYLGPSETLERDAAPSGNTAAPADE
ncbi:hypothetical protein L593_02580 [Salinarchaeum sp. Harcht-Bsk1]|nr:hypothetical protein L593_02580 [Salinarchaeum sp. Harcht-Bsk1]